MVNAAVLREDGSIRWFGYLMVSFCVVMIAAAGVEFRQPVAPLDVPQVLKVSLRALAAPKQAPILPVSHPPLRQTPTAPPIVTQAQASKKIAPISQKPEMTATPPKKIVQPLLSAKPIEKPTPPKPLLKELTVRAQPHKADLEMEPDADAAAEQGAGRSEATAILNPRYRKQVAPNYPRRSFELGQQGVVLLHAEVMPNGKPKSLKIYKSSGHRRLDLAALSAVKKWEFETQSNQVAWVRVPVRFKIN